MIFAIAFVFSVLALLLPEDARFAEDKLGYRS